MNKDQFKITIGIMITSVSKDPEFHLHLERVSADNKEQSLCDALISDRVICPFTSYNFGDVVSEAIVWAKFLNIEFILEDKFKYPLKLNNNSYPCPYDDYAKAVYKDYHDQLRKQREPRRIMVANVDMEQDWEATISLAIPYTDTERAEKNGGFFFAQYTQTCEKGLVTTCIRTRGMEFEKLIPIEQVDFKDNFIDIKNESIFVYSHPESEFTVSSSIFTYKNKMSKFFSNGKGDT